MRISASKKSTFEPSHKKYLIENGFTATGANFNRRIDDTLLVIGINKDSGAFEVTKIKSNPVGTPPETLVTSNFFGRACLYAFEVVTYLQSKDLPDKKSITETIFEGYSDEL